MHTVRARACQTLCALVIGALSMSAPTRAEPTPTPPSWQREIDAARLLEGTLALVPAKDPADQEARQVRVEALYRRLAQTYPGESGVQKAAADYFTRGDKLMTALSYWDRAARLAPGDADISSRLGGIYLRLGRTRDAYARLQTATLLQPGVASYHFDLGNVLYLFRRDLVAPPTPGLPDEQAALTQALAQFRRAAELAPGDLRLALAYAETFYIFPAPDWTQALAAWETVLLLSGEKSDFPNSHLARISLRMGRPDDAAEYLARIHDPTFDDLKAKLLQKADEQRGSREHR